MKLKELNLKYICELINEGLVEIFCELNKVRKNDFFKYFIKESEKIKDKTNFHIVIFDNYSNQDGCYTYYHTDLEELIYNLYDLENHSKIIEKAILNSVLNNKPYSIELFNLLKEISNNEDFFIFNKYEDFFDEFRIIDEGVVADSFENSGFEKSIISKTLDDFVKGTFLDDNYIEERINDTTDQFNNLYDAGDYNNINELEGLILECFGLTAAFEEAALTYSNYDAQDFLEKNILKQVIKKLEIQKEI